MKTIAISIDEHTLAAIDGLTKTHHDDVRSRSALVRRALQDFIERAQKQKREEREKQIFKKHRDKLGVQATALVKEQSSR